MTSAASSAAAPASSHQLIVRTVASGHPAHVDLTAGRFTTVPATPGCGPFLTRLGTPCTVRGVGIHLLQAHVRPGELLDLSDRADELADLQMLRTNATAGGKRLVSTDCPAGVERVGELWVK